VRIQRLYIGDFGVFRNQTLDSLSTGLIVVGGLNRAGKTTFLQILRHLGYGLPRVQSLPPASSRYEIESDVILDSGDRYCIRLLGYGEPQISCLTGGGGICGCSEIYNNLDAFTYRQLFTISLDELQGVQDGTDKQSQKKLQSIMLGAGLTDIVGIPQVVDELVESAKDLGGKHGRVSVARFKEFYNDIEEGLALRNDAIRQVDLYQDRQKKLEDITNEIHEGQAQARYLRSELTRLDVLKSNFENYAQIESLRESLDVAGAEELISAFREVRIETVMELYKQYQAILQEFAEQSIVFGQSIIANDVTGCMNRLLSCSAHLEDLKYGLSGLRERSDKYIEQYRDYERTEDDINAELTRINKSWYGQFESVLELECDKLQLDEVVQDVNTYQQLNSSLCDYERESAKLSSTKDQIETEIRTITVSKEDTVLKQYFYLAFLFVLGGMALSVSSFWFGMIVAGIGIIGAAVYAFVKFAMSNSLRERKLSLELQLKGVVVHIQRTTDEMMCVKVAASELERKIGYYRELLRLGPDVSPAMIKEYFRDVQELKKAILSWMSRGERLQETHLAIEQKLRSIVALLRQLQGVIVVGSYGNSLLDHREQLFSLLEEAVDILDSAKALKNVGDRKESIEKEIREIVQCESDEELLVVVDAFIRKGQEAIRLSDMKAECERLEKQIMQSLKMDVVKKALTDCADGSDETGDLALIHSFAKLYKQFFSLDSVRKAYEDCSAELVSLEKRMEGLKDIRRSLVDELERLATTERLEQAQQKIDRARAGLRPLAEEYAVYNAASFVLRKVQDRFMQNTKDTLLRDASCALKKITEGEYVQILPPDDLSEVDFKAVLTDGTRQDTVDILSRATREQLFLSVRFSRIREVHPPLPVIMDDSFVNFDRHHLEQAIAIIRELSQTHQIFLLTCHPHLVAAIQKHTHNAQYWRLERGRFNLSSGGELIRYLHAKDDT
jgi:uncharacterized protein YhaN